MEEDPEHFMNLKSNDGGEDEMVTLMYQYIDMQMGSSTGVIIINC